MLGLPGWLAGSPPAACLFAMARLKHGYVQTFGLLEHEGTSAVVREGETCAHAI